MCQSMKVKFRDRLTYVKLMEAHERASKNKRSKREVLRFEIDLESNMTNLYRKLQNHTYHLGKYREFTIYEPKERVIKSLPYLDRIVHQWYVEEFIKPFFVPRFIKDSYACIEDKGSHLAVENMQKYMRIMKRNCGTYYILKCDIRKYFYNIDRDILFSIVKKRMEDPELIDFTRLLIYEGSNEKIGIPIGNYTSQYFANIYLNELDHYVKEVLRVRFYCRYMDDFILLVPTKQEAKELKEKIEKFVRERLHLELNQKTNYYPNAMGVNFCGYRIFETHRLLRTSSKKRIKRQVKRWNKAYQSGTYDLAHIEASWNSWLGHSCHANTFMLQNKIYDQILLKEQLKSPSVFWEELKKKQEASEAEAKLG